VSILVEEAVSVDSVAEHGDAFTLSEWRRSSVEALEKLPLQVFWLKSSAGSEARTISRAASNMRETHYKPLFGGPVHELCRTSSAISGDVSFMRYFLPQVNHAQFVSPTLDIGLVATSGNQIFYVPHLQIRKRESFAPAKVLTGSDLLC